MSRSKARAAFEARLGHSFDRPDLLRRALTHASAATEGRPDNQRLEFLGDRVLGLVIAEALMGEAPDAAEGELAPRLNALVRKETCAEVAAEIDVGDAMTLGRSELLSGGRRRVTILGDAMEAVIAAVYLDAGLDAARQLILRHWGARIAASEGQALDAKTALQEWAQARGLQPPRYVEAGRSGPDHAPTFVIVARLETGVEAEGRAPSKRAAQQEAAAALLERIEDPDEVQP